MGGVLAQALEMPEPYTPDYQKWCEIFERMPINEDTMLVGHSCGGGFLVRWLSENKVRVGKVALVAPWTDPMEDEKFANNMFADFKLDPTFHERTAATRVFISKERHPDVEVTVDMLKKEIPDLDVQFVPDLGHFTMGDMKTEEFPELRDYLLNS